jgi:hypothetical protein
MYFDGYKYNAHAKCMQLLAAAVCIAVSAPSLQLRLGLTSHLPACTHWLSCGLTPLIPVASACTSIEWLKQAVPDCCCAAAATAAATPYYSRTQCTTTSTAGPLLPQRGL